MEIVLDAGSYKSQVQMRSLYGLGRSETPGPAAQGSVTAVETGGPEAVSSNME